MFLANPAVGDTAGVCGVSAVLYSTYSSDCKISLLSSVDPLRNGNVKLDKNFAV